MGICGAHRKVVSVTDTTKSRVTNTQSTPCTALITGAARRIGACIAETLHQRGCDVFLHYRSSSDAVEELAGKLNARRPASASILQADLGDSEDINRLAGLLEGRISRLDLLVNNASRFFPTTVGATSAKQWDELMDSNLRGPYFLTQALLPLLTTAGGSVVNILDVHAVRPMSGHAVYCMAKAGLQMMTLSLARELGPQVRVNGVAPGAILWPEQALTSEYQQGVLDKTVMGRAGRPEDIASAVAYLGLDAPYVTGQVLAVDGGRSLNI
jgi:pteridine reductase